MIVKTLRRLIFFFAAGAAVLLMCIAPAAAGVRPEIGKPLQAAQAAAAAGNYQAAMADLRQAEAVSGQTAEEQKIVAQMRDYVSVKCDGACGVSSGIGAQAKFDADYRAGRYGDAIADEELLRRYGEMTAANRVIIGQAYYRAGDYKGCMHYAADHADAGPDMVELQAQCAYKSGSNADMLDAAAHVVALSGTPDHWSQLLKLAEATKGLSDPQMLDIYRLKYLTGTFKSADDYFTLAQLLIAGGLPSEAVGVVDKGMQLKVLNDTRAQRLLALVQRNQGADLAGLAAAAKAANASPKGDDLVKLGEDYCGMGRYADAVGAIEAGLKKGTADADKAQIRLGQALYGAGRKEAALKAFAETTTGNGKLDGRLWSLYVKEH